ncbi:unnamed protein product [Ascophyllum nodosum]
MILSRVWVLLSALGVSCSFEPAVARGLRLAPARPLAKVPKVGVRDSDAGAFERITLARRATKRFERRPVPDVVLKKVLGLVLRAPSGFNIQPYECVVVTSDEAKQKLSKAMLGENQQRVLDAGATVVFASDLNSMQNVKKLRTLLEKEGWPKEFIKSFSLYLSVFSTGHSRLFRLPLVVAKRVSFAIAGRLGKPMPTVAGAETWAFKNTMLAVQASQSRQSSSEELLLAATSCGVASCPMEGFDMRRLRRELGIPLRYSVPIVVSLGYPSKAERDFKTLRFAPEEVFHRDEFGTTLEGVPVL